MPVPDSLAIDGYLRSLRTTIDRALERVLQAAGAPDPLAEPLRYALLGPGKRLRPCLTLAVAETVGLARGLERDEAQAMALPAACAVEMVHTYSLVHDDLPAMDDDALRRGRPTTHVVYGDGLAILAGDGLLTDAFGVLAGWPSPASDRPIAKPDADRTVRAVALLAQAAGSAGMVGGQAIDLAWVGHAAVEASAIGADALEDMHLRKTGALIRAACVLGALMTGGTPAVVEAVDAYARDLGLAFQIIDDVLDVEGASASLGKTAGKDAAAGKPTFPALYGLDRSKAMAEACVGRAAAALEAQGLGGRLDELAEWSLRRTN